MKAHLIQLSTVVIGKVHNPTILNPDFLAMRNIVSSDWKWEVAETITTPPFAIVRYKSGIAVTIEHSKLQVTDVAIAGDPTQSKASQIAAAYVAALPHVRYTAVGLNFHSVVEVDSPETCLKHRFLKQGDWDSAVHPITAAGFRFVYPLDPSGRVTLSLDAGEVERASEGSARNSVIVANANFHRDCTGYPADKQIQQYLDQLAADWLIYRTLLADTLEVEE